MSLHTHKNCSSFLFNKRLLHAWNYWTGRRHVQLSSGIWSDGRRQREGFPCEATTLLGLKYEQSFLPQASKQPSLPKRLLKAIFSPC